MTDERYRVLMGIGSLALGAVYAVRHVWWAAAVGALLAALWMIDAARVRRKRLDREARLRARRAEREADERAQLRAKP
jgi:UDP-N-acetylmuramyl pentapeptide phosphotransferase/UDP-N-acetylglucosamine-1-phosphate transferase